MGAFNVVFSSLVRHDEELDIASILVPAPLYARAIQSEKPRHFFQKALSADFKGLRFWARFVSNDPETGFIALKTDSRMLSARLAQ